jgi:competence protein ComEC
VLLISNGRRSVLLAGDISSRIERRLPKQPVDLLMAPHHGSRTSSSKSFVRGFAPAIVFVSTDRRSRFGHPHPDVVERYEDARLLITGRAGALIWRSDVPAEAFSWRAHRAAYWQRQFSGLEVDAVQSVDDVP